MNTNNELESTEEEIEGYSGDEDSSWGDYPIDTLLIRNENRTIHDVIRRIEKGSYIMDPEFQRDFIWPIDKQSKLIESVLMRIPLPVFYLAEDTAGNMIVVDGLQRLSTFRRFVNNQLPLKLPSQPELNTKRFKDLSAKLQNRVEDCNLVLYIIDAKVPERARLDIFERVNGGVPLTRQQMRNCLYMGKATKFLKEEAHADLFIQATGGSLKSSTMRDREFVNRFCSFQLLNISDYRGDMDDFLAQGLMCMNNLSDAELAKLSNQLRTTLINNYNIFGQYSFRKHREHGGGRSIINASLWDVMSTGFSKYSESVVENFTEALREAFYGLMEDDEFIRAITYGPNDPKKVRLRFKLAHAAIDGVLYAYTT
ncbi:MAG: DUF262 domain-containing protein [Desulfovibrionaceae bacterium]